MDNCLAFTYKKNIEIVLIAEIEQDSSHSAKNVFGKHEEL